MKRQAPELNGDVVVVDPDLARLTAYARTVPDGGSHSQRAYDIILGAILTRVLPSGKRLAEIPVARAINVGRTPVREALLRLETDGFVRSETRVGMVVASNTVESFADIYEVREALEALASRLAARYSRATDHVALKRILAESEPPTETHDTARLRMLNTRFHETIHACGRNNQLRQTLRYQINQLRLSPISAYDVPGHAEKALAEHQAILQAIMAQDEDQAARLAGEHIHREKEVRLGQLALADLDGDA
jgi:DNA-binding GntR family transcriptional regulator